MSRTCSLTLAFLLALPAIAAERPNVVMIMTDNHGAWTLGCYGNRDIRTPHLDRLAREGTLMTRCFSSNAVCSPTRATWLTGLMPSQHGVHCFIAGSVQSGPEALCTIEEFHSIPKVLKHNGYVCGLSGKWHLGDHLNPHEGFSFWVAKRSGSTAEFYDQPVVDQGRVRKEPGHLTDYFTRRGIDFIRENKERPFFLYLAYNGPYGLGRLLLNEPRGAHAEHYADQPLKSFPREPMHPWMHRNREYLNNPVSMRRYAAEVSRVDDGVGRVMQTLRELKLDDNTLVIFCGDQGLAGGHSGIWGMGDHTMPISAFDSTMHVPLIIRHPGRVKEGQRLDLMVSNYDLYPTLLEHLEIEPDPQFDEPGELARPGRSFAKPLAGETIVWDQTTFYEFETIRAVRTRGWKYVEHIRDGPRELYRLNVDPGERRNLVGEQQSSLVERQLQSRLRSFFQRHASPKHDLTKRGGESKARFLFSDSEAKPRVHASNIDRSFTFDATTAVRVNVRRGEDGWQLEGWQDGSRVDWSFGRADGAYALRAEGWGPEGNELRISIDGQPAKTLTLPGRSAEQRGPGPPVRLNLNAGMHTLRLEATPATVVTRLHLTPADP